MYRNAEILETRLRRLDDMRAKANRHADMAYFGASTSEERSRIEEHHAALLDRLDYLSQRVWRALCVAKGWRKA